MRKVIGLNRYRYQSIGLRQKCTGTRQDFYHYLKLICLANNRRTRYVVVQYRVVKGILQILMKFSASLAFSEIFGLIQSVMSFYWTFILPLVSNYLNCKFSNQETKNFSILEQALPPTVESRSEVKRLNQQLRNNFYQFPEFA